MMHKPEFISPDWPAPANVKALQTTRAGGFSTGNYASLNLGDHVKDNPLHVAHNRQSLSPFLPTEPVWLQQVHGIRVIDASTSSCIETADASFSTRKEVVCVTMTADCLPVLLCDEAGSVVAAIHAGWRSLCDGVIEATVNAMPVEAAQLMAWLGPAIGPDAFEVGGEVRAQFIAQDAQAETAFRPQGDKWLGDLYTIARQRLNTLGIHQIYGGGRCTFNEPDTFFSFRRDGDTGRMATMIWLE
ncbi:MAG TPA: peptidoglycan editing factor PgeF [Methylophilus sp.]|uniref:peptidoglycan editing factor PgeF n=1 Tax=Methylophilus sp. TaxID=29541 RepID=UPI002CF2A054|nr:peptidoglycan editing factor PgeF [Methylophilus sp.]HSH87422.1 peptidoglycan editing factor PgeF [Methylophilus sp.]